MEQIRAIETHYKGYRFRSRLEARWAVFLDAANIEYQYEVEGFKIGTCNENIYYLPDFFLPKENCYVEVKGTDEALFSDGKKIAYAVDFDASPCSRGLLILGDIPDPTRISFGNFPMFSYLWNRKSIQHEYAAFLPDIHTGDKIHLVIGGNNILKEVFIYNDIDNSDAICDENIPKKASTKCRWTLENLKALDIYDPKSGGNLLLNAYTKARQARFEHGETPII